MVIQKIIQDKNQTKKIPLGKIRQMSRWRFGTWFTGTIDHSVGTGTSRTAPRAGWR